MSTEAWQSSHEANNAPEGREAMKAHLNAHRFHAESYLDNLQHAKNTSSAKKREGWKYAAGLHRKAAEEHYQKYKDSYETHMKNSGADRKLNPIEESDMPDMEKIVTKQKLASR